MKTLLDRARRNPALALGVAIAIIIGAAALFPGLFSQTSPLEIDMGRALQPPSTAHPFGTDHVGRDVYSRVVHGAGVTLGIVSGSLALSAIFGGLTGLFAGYLRGFSDLATGQFTGVILSFPPIFLGVMITGILGSSVANLVVAMAIIYFPLFVRVARSSTMVEASRSYTEAAQVLGAGDLRVIFRHLLPNVLPAVLTQYIILFPLALQIQAALGFLGLGVQPPTPDWGASLQESKDYVLFASWTAIFPGLALILSSLAVILIGRGLQSKN
ncbi:ABC transporter permease [Pseudohoeflea coraliihabitans]|uniref:ABC transporter permease n=1 Tax=Pseudohoeflea coraliihabitans TaxID=2860393 RepID=A0ABS6WJ83_9HYPH|nr:ABC transporter permease [Pseudohoeflea sp. DP4N28-3]MBW3096008.1 ABC transporter permease [Pseudohoeflea sp. DP4N28-3]